PKLPGMPRTHSDRSKNKQSEISQDDAALPSGEAASISFYAKFCSHFYINLQNKVPDNLLGQRGRRQPLVAKIL
ncbi:MAG: hypothetical protein WAX80_02265, partial [Minisyncoccia bacterium]